jgi:chemotaxis protein MotB
MTYADMITLLLCFFAVFLSVSIPKKEKFERAREEVQQRFGVPDVIAGKFPPHDIPHAESEKREIPKDSLPSIIDKYEDKKDVQVQKKGDRINRIELNSASFFTSGSAVLSSQGGNLLADVLKVIQTDQFKDYVITVEGHTDDNPIRTAQFPSNWELSTARAAAVVRYFLEAGIPASRLRASGYADTFPKVPNRDASGKPIPDNQAQNRRVIIKLEKIDKDNHAG